jgi:hypothetical protein
MQTERGGLGGRGGKVVSLLVSESSRMEVGVYVALSYWCMRS